MSFAMKCNEMKKLIASAISLAMSWSYWPDSNRRPLVVGKGTLWKRYFSYIQNYRLNLSYFGV